MTSGFTRARMSHIRNVYQKIGMLNLARIEYIIFLEYIIIILYHMSLKFIYES